MTKVKIFRHCSTINFTEDYFRQQYLKSCHPRNKKGNVLKDVNYDIAMNEKYSDCIEKVSQILFNSDLAPRKIDMSTEG